MTNVIDWLLDLFRDPVRARAFVNDPERAMQNAGVQNVTAAQVQAVAATVAPAAVIHGGGDPVFGLQQAVAETHGIAFTPQPEHVFAPETQAFSNNDTLSHNDVLSPQAGHDVQQGGVNLDFGDITFGNKTTNVADHGGVVVDGNSSGDILTDGSVKQGAGSTANTGDIHSGSHSPVIVGSGNDVHDNSQTAGGDIIDGNSGNIIKDNNLGGGDGGNAHAGGGIFGGGTANAGGGGGAGSITVNDSSNHSTTTNTGGGDITNVNTGGADVHGNIDASHHDDNSVHTDNSTHDSHNDSSVHTDNSVHQQVDTHVDTGLHLGF
jgi:hypothetical protein